MRTYPGGVADDSAMPHAVYRHRSDLPLELERAALGGDERLAHRRVDRVRAENLAGIRHGAQAARDVDRVADDRELESARRADVAGEHFSRVEPDADLQLRRSEEH